MGVNSDVMAMSKRKFAENFGVSVRTVDNWMHRGMPVIKIGRRVLCDSASAEWVRGHRTTMPAGGTP